MLITIICWVHLAGGPQQPVKIVFTEYARDSFAAQKHVPNHGAEFKRAACANLNDALEASNEQ